MRELAVAFGERADRLGDLPWWRRQEAAVGRLPDGGTGARLARCLEVLLERYGDTRIAVGSWHGDWTPWNMARRGPRVLVWDWERFETGVPVGLDWWHHQVQTATRARGIAVDVVLAALGRSGAGEGTQGLVAGLYLLALSTRYAELVAAERGADIAAGARVMTDALVAHTRRTGGVGVTG